MTAGYVFEQEEQSVSRRAARSHQNLKGTTRRRREFRPAILEGQKAVRQGYVLERACEPASFRPIQRASGVMSLLCTYLTPLKRP